jgi:FlgD Ig-like domain
VRRPGMIVLALVLVAGAVAAFTYTEALKLETKPVGTARVDRWLSPVCDCPRETAQVRFRLREPKRLEVTVVDEDGDRVRVLESGVPHPAGRVMFSWDGRDDAGRVVSDGAYRVRVRLLDERRTIAIPVDMNVDTTAPRVRLLGVSPTVVEYEGDLRVRYRSNEPGRTILSVDGTDLPRGARRDAGRRLLVGPVIVDGAPLAPGIHTIALAVVDRAGNVSPRTTPVAILVREPAQE